jgi:hypothetical protein
MGGIDSADGTMRDITGESRNGKGVKGIPVGLFHKNGLWLDDLAVVYNPSLGITDPLVNTENANVYEFEKTIYVDLDKLESKQNTILLYDLTGKLVVSQKLIAISNSIDVSNLNSGLYLYQINGGNIQKAGKLFIK